MDSRFYWQFILYFLEDGNKIIRTDTLPNPKLLSSFHFLWSPTSYVISQWLFWIKEKKMLQPFLSSKAYNLCCLLHRLKQGRTAEKYHTFDK